MLIQLDQYPELRFCRVLMKTKKPFEEGWTQKPYTWKEISEHLDLENYGILCGYGNLAVIDADKDELQKHIERILPNTFRVRTGGGGTHNYFFVPGLTNKIVLTLTNRGVDTHYGEVQSYGTQVVGPGSMHPNGKYYEPINEEKIATIAKEDLMSAIEPFLNEVKETFEAKEEERKNYGSKIDEMSVTNIWGTSGLKKQGSEWYGSHPIHGSESGMNFWINPSKNLWHCFRCQSGGGPLSAIAVKEGIISCSEAQRGNLRGDKAIQSIIIAKEKYGLPDDYNLDLQTMPIQNYEIPKEFTLIWDKELKDYKDEDREWLIDKLIPSCSVGVWTGKRATYKTFTALDAAYSIAVGIPFLGMFSTKKCKVLYLDKENGIPIVKARVEMIKKGKGIIDDCDVGFICFSTLKLDKLKDIQAIEKLIEEHKPKVLFIDTYRRAITYDENDAGEVSKLFVDTLRPLVEKYRITIILIHHDKKESHENSGDEMDQIRGSSDLANYADFILKNKRAGIEKKLVIEQVKNRNAPEYPPIEIKFDTDDETYIKFGYEGEFKPQTRDERCAQEILLWLTKESIKEFKTKDLEPLALDKGIKRRSLFYGIKLLEERGVVKKIGYGEYETTDQARLNL